MAVKVITNNMPRLVIDGYELTADERKRFDYINWDDENVSPTFFRYKGELYHIEEFVANTRDTGGGTTGTGDLSAWDGYMSDSFFSGIVIRLVNDNDHVIVGRFYS